MKTHKAMTLSRDEVMEMLQSHFDLQDEGLKVADFYKIEPSAMFRVLLDEQEDDGK